MANQYIEGNGVFKNKLGLTDGKQLKAIEYAFTERNSKLLLTGLVDFKVVSYGLDRLSSIHKFLFQDLYEWAGKPRTVPSSKRASNGTITWFAESNAIFSIWKELEPKCNNFAINGNPDFSQKIDALIDIFILANFSHPFPEGNGRSLQVFLRQLANTQCLGIDYSQVKEDEWNHASAVSGKHGRLFEHSIPIYAQPDSDPLKRIFSRIISPIGCSQEIPDLPKVAPTQEKTHTEKSQEPQKIGTKPERELGD